MNNYLILNGLLVILLGNLGGVAYSKSMRKIIKNEESWRVFHTASLSGGILLLTFSSFFERLTHAYPYAQVLFYSIIASNYLFLIGMFLAAVFGQRGIDKTEKGFINIVVYACYFVAAILSFYYTVSLIYIILTYQK